MKLCVRSIQESDWATALKVFITLGDNGKFVIYCAACTKYSTLHGIYFDGMSVINSPYWYAEGFWFIYERSNNEST